MLFCFCPAAHTSPWWFPLYVSHWASQSSNTRYKKRNVGVLSAARVWLQAFCREIFGEVIKASLKPWYTAAGNPSNVNIYMSCWRDEKPFQSRLLLFGFFFFFYSDGSSCMVRLLRLQQRWNAVQKSCDRDTAAVTTVRSGIRHGFITRLRLWYVIWGIKKRHYPVH